MTPNTEHSTGALLQRADGLRRNLSGNFRDQLVQALYADAETRAVMLAAVAALPPREREVIVRRFGLLDDSDGATLEEIAHHVGNVSRERVRQIESQALRALRTALCNAGVREA